MNWLPVISRALSLPSLPVMTNCAAVGLAGSFSIWTPRGVGTLGLASSGVNPEILVVEGKQILNGARGGDGERLGRKGASALGPGERERVARVKQRRRGIVHRRDVGKQIGGCGRGSAADKSHVATGQDTGSGGHRARGVQVPVDGCFRGRGRQRAGAERDGDVGQLPGHDGAVELGGEALDVRAGAGDKLIGGVERESAIARVLLNAAVLDDEESTAIDGQIRIHAGGLDRARRKSGWMSATAAPRPYWLGLEPPLSAEGGEPACDVT